MPTITYAQALNEALREEMQVDPRVFLMGEDIGHHGGIFRVTKDLIDEFGAERVRDTPISESSFVGLGIGAAGEGPPATFTKARSFTANPVTGSLNRSATVGRAPARMRAPTEDHAMFDTLTDKLDGTFKKLRSRGKLHPKQVDNALDDMRTALLEADVAVEVADAFLGRVRARSLSARGSPAGPRSRASRWR